MKEYLIVYRKADGKHGQMTTQDVGLAKVTERFLLFCQEQKIDPVSVTIEQTNVRRTA